VKKEGRIVLVVIFCLCLITSALTFAADKDIVKLQGIVMAVDAKKNLFTVNERSFAWDKQTTVYTEKGVPTTFDKLKEQGWVYIEGVPDRVNRRNVAKKIYLLPKYINGKEKHLYPFME
jgi:hypothetical protein